MPSNVLVLGAGSDVNGLYVYDGTHNGKGKWSLSATKYIQADDFGGGLFWYIVAEDVEGQMYVLESDTEYPWQGAYLTYNGSEPLPTVTEVPVLSQPTFGLPADVVALITSRFGTVANFLRLRNQGQI